MRAGWQARMHSPLACAPPELGTGCPDNYPTQSHALGKKVRSPASQIQIPDPIKLQVSDGVLQSRALARTALIPSDMSTNLYTDIHISTYIYIYKLYMYIYMQMHMQTSNHMISKKNRHPHTHIYVCTYVCMYVRTYVCMHLCMYVYM